MQGAKQVIVVAIMAAGLSVIGCKSKDHPNSDHPNADHPTKQRADHPRGDHPR